MCAQPAKAPRPEAGRRQRRHPRYLCEFSINLTLFSGTKHQQFEARGKDLSEAGLGALIAHDIPIGEVVSLAFSLPESAVPWTVRAVMRQRRGYHYGFEFLALSAEQTEELKGYLPKLKRADSD